jgi:hypothetical protein
MDERAITADNFGAWLFKAAPDVWDLDGYLASGETRFRSWSVVESYRTAMMGPGQRAFVWAGRGFKSVPSGVIAAGTLVDLPNDDTGDEYWLHKSDRESLRLFAFLDVSLIDRVVTREEFLEDPVLSQAEVIKQPQMGNPTFLTKEEVAALDLLMRADGL